MPKNPMLISCGKIKSKRLDIMDFFTYLYRVVGRERIS